MKTFKILVLLFIISFSILMNSCIKDEYPTKGMLIGYDIRDCACCGGFLLNLDNETTFNDNTKVAGSLPSDFIFKPDEFPIRVQFDYENGGGCLNNNIVITKIKRR